jgi:calnexin
VGARGGSRDDVFAARPRSPAPRPHTPARPPQILIDHKSEKAGSLLTDFAPPFIPPTEIDDPEDKKPADWVDEAKIADVTDAKPEDWDEDAPRLIDDEAAVKPAAWADDAPAMIADPKASKPADWNDDMLKTQVMQKDEKSWWKR